MVIEDLFISLHFIHQIRKYVVIDFQYYPHSDRVPEHLEKILNTFRFHVNEIDSVTNNLSEERKISNQVLRVLAYDLKSLGLHIEADGVKLKIRVLDGAGRKLQNFFPDGWWAAYNTILEIEAGRAYANHQFLKDLFEACVMDCVDYLVIAVRNEYRRSKDFLKVKMFFNTLYTSRRRWNLPLKGVMIIGY